VARASPPPDASLFVFIHGGGVYSVANSCMSGRRFNAALAIWIVCLQYFEVLVVEGGRIGVGVIVLRLVRLADHELEVARRYAREHVVV